MDIKLPGQRERSSSLVGPSWRNRGWQLVVHWCRTPVGRRRWCPRAKGVCYLAQNHSIGSYPNYHCPEHRREKGMRRYRSKIPFLLKVLISLSTLQFTLLRARLVVECDARSDHTLAADYTAAKFHPQYPISLPPLAEVLTREISPTLGHPHSRNNLFFIFIASAENRRQRSNPFSSR